MHAYRNACRVAIALLITVQVGLAQQGYKKPPKEVLDILNAPVTPGISVSPTRDNVILTTGLRYPPLADPAQTPYCHRARATRPSPISRNRCCDSPGVVSIPRQTRHTVTSIQSR